ncbi:MAG: purine-nucleoside phosphorylase [Oscillospiraceae bacterium]
MFYEQVSESAAFLKDRVPHIPTVGVILGSGLGGLVDTMEDKTVLPYKDIPHFPQSHLAGHAGNFVFGRIGNVQVAAMQGRFHSYEGFDMKEVTYPVYVMKHLGVESLIVTNAAGGIDPSFTPGDLMIIEDYINLMGRNPLTGPNDERFGPRFPDMSEAYSRALIAKAEAAAGKLGIVCQRGVYLALTGPSFETAAEIRAFATLGAHAVGMSTVPETIVANYLGMKVFGLSCITNMATGISVKKHSHEDVLRIASESSERLCALVGQMLADWNG